MVEHPVQEHAQAPVAGGGDQPVEVGVVAEPGIDAEVVDRVVAVGLRVEDRAQLQARAAQLDGVVEPVLQVPQAVPYRLGGGEGGGFGAGEPERVHVPPDRVVGP
nr:hypothetical protein GCM10020093_032390 [Planobispora longispora]